jgi:hypothetical protein
MLRAASLAEADQWHRIECVFDGTYTAHGGALAEFNAQFSSTLHA